MKRLTEILLYNPFEEHLGGGDAFSVTLDRGAFSLCHLRKRGRALEVEFYNRFPVSDPYPGPPEVVSTVKVVLSERGINVRDVILSVPREWVLVRPVELPLSVEENLPEVIAYEMDRYTPFTAEQVFYDYALLQRTETTLKIALYVVRKDQLTPYVERFGEEGLGLKLATFGPAAAALLEGLVHPDRSSLIVNSCNGQTVLSLNVHGNPVSVETFTDDEGLLRRIDELQKEGVLGFRPEVVVLEDVEKEALHGRVSVPTVSAGELRTERFPIGNGQGDLSSIGASASGVLRGVRPVNLLSRGRREKEKRPLGLSYLLAAGVLVLLILNITLPFVRDREEVRILTEEIDALKADVRAVETLRSERKTLAEKIGEIRRFKASAPLMLETLKEITRLLPDNTWLTRLKVTEREVFLEGYSESATGLISVLESSGLLKNASFTSPTIKDRRLNKERFRIKAELERGDNDRQ